MLSVAGSAWSQDSHYWTEQYGNRARLLGGAVIGGGTDIAVVYYNPGALALMEKPEILLAGNVFQIQNVKAEPPSPGVAGSTSTGLSLSPSLLAGQLRREVFGGKFAYSFLTHASADFRLEGQSNRLPDEIDIPNVLFESNNTLIIQDLSDHWFGGTWSRAFGDTLGIGISTFVAVRSQTTRFQDSFTALAQNNRAGTSSLVRDFSYYHVRLLWKLGVATHWDKWQLGFTATTPSLSIAGNGTSTFNATRVVQGVDASGRAQSFVAADRQSVSSEYRSPLSLGVGASRSFGATKLYLSTEWFNSVGAYEILNTEPFQAQSSGETLSSDVIQELDSVINVAVGVEHALNSGRRVYGSFWTDFNASAEDSTSNVAGSPFNLYHFGGGYSFAVGSSDVTLGGVVALGSTETVVSPTLQELGGGVVKSSFTRVTFLIGFNFGLMSGG
jgi:hypothetical protein